MQSIFPNTVNCGNVLLSSSALPQSVKIAVWAHC